MDKSLHYCILSPSDIDECALGTDVCDQTCTDTLGSYACSCMTGYTLDANGRSCNGMQISQFIAAW